MTQNTHRRLTALFFAVLGALIAAGCGSPPNPDATLRILTYNTAFVSITIDSPWPVPDVTIRPNEYHFSNTTVDERAHKIADAVLRGDQEIVLLNEVFSDDARQILINRLQGTYPNYVSKLAGMPVISAPTFHYLLQEAAFPIPVPDIPGIGDFLVYPGDSGLMVFSKYPFLPLTGPNPQNDADCSDSACAVEGRNTANPSNVLATSEVAFDIYHDCAGTDCFASKGLGLVKVQTPIGPSYVGFTHLQADYPPLDYHVPERLAQYAQMKQHILGSIPPGEIGQVPIYLAGDLNTPGENKADNTSSEWLEIYHPSTPGDRFWACGNDPSCIPANTGALMTDTWGFETSPLDPGLTNYTDGERLDYILHNKRSSRPCMQHVMIAYDLVEDVSTWYSDHMPVRADFNARLKWCSPNLDALLSFAPQVIAFPDTDCDNDPSTLPGPCQQDMGFGPAQGANLSHAGSFQWFTIDQAGSYSIKIDPATPGEEVKFDVYQGEDLSRPLEPFDDSVHPEWGLPFDLLNPPYYIRVYAVDNSSQQKPERTMANRGYYINFHQHLCRDAEDACFLPAGDPVDYEHPFKWPANTAFTQVDDAYFRFKTSGVRDGHLDPDPAMYPSVKIRNEVAASWDIGCFRMTIEEYTASYPPTFVAEHPFLGSEQNTNQHFIDDWDADGLKDIRYIAPDLDGDTFDELKNYYAVVQRQDNFGCEQIIGTNVHFETNLGYFVAHKVNCYAQYDDSGIGEDDHIRFKAFIDPGPNFPWWNYCDGNPFCEYQVFDEPGGDGYLDHVANLQGYFVDDVHLYLYEEESGGPDFHLGLWSGDIDPVDPYDEQVYRTDLIYADGSNPDDADYYYRVQYRVCRENRNCNP